MNAALRNIRNFLATPGPNEVRYANYEVLVMRLCFVVLIYQAMFWEINYTTQPRPNGLAEWGLDFTFFGDPGIMAHMKTLTILALAFFAAGVVPWLALTWILFVAVGIGTLANSQGAIGHHTQIVTLSVLAQCAAHWVRPRLMTSLETENRAVRWTLITIAAAYIVSGLVKTIRSYGLWIWKSPALAVQFMKTRQMEYFDYQENEHAGSLIDQMPELILAYPNAARLIFGTALILELACFLILLGRRWSAIYGLVLICMHTCISLVMRHHFENNVAALAIFLVNPVFWIVAGYRRMRGGEPETQMPP